MLIAPNDCAALAGALRGLIEQTAERGRESDGWNGSRVTLPISSSGVWMLVAALIIPLAFVIAARLLGDH
jgi:hypothetical protein